MNHILDGFFQNYPKYKSTVHYRISSSLKAHSPQTILKRIRAFEWEISRPQRPTLFFGRADPDLVFFLELVTELQRDELGWCDWQGALE